ncbi:hypothetical protein [Rhizobium sp. AN6A]|uniref:hypothetical protein n=1 Tax=Rhizobium sp. AN6A TaxID=1841611 RepID=UPI002B23254D|nr:hypothetical protein [Rhizobium sp. AN6A]
MAGTPGPFPKANAAGDAPTTAVRGAAAATTKKTMCEIPTAFFRSLKSSSTNVIIFPFFIVYYSIEISSKDSNIQ